jgi:hypothetical protein
MMLAALLTEARYSNHHLDSAALAQIEQALTRLRSRRPTRRSLRS